MTDTTQQQDPRPVKSKEPDGWSRFLWWLAAADPDVLADCRADRERYRIIGLAVLVTALFATLAWGYFFSTVVKDDLLIYGLALFFGFAVLCIDRSLIAAMQRNGKVQVLPVAFRLILAITIGLFISQPVVLMLFQKDVQAQMVVDRQKKMEDFRKQQTAYNSERTTRLRTQLAGLDKTLADREKQVKDYKDAYIRETDGTGGSGKIGEYAIAKVKRNEYLKAEDELRQLRSETATLREGPLAELALIQAEDSTRESAYRATLTDGFLAQVEALNTLTEEKPPLKQRYRLIVFIITLIEIMPLLTKLMMPKGEYDARLAAITASSINESELSAAQQKQLQQHFTEGAGAADKEVMDHIFGLTASARRRESEKLVEEWERADGRSFRKLWASARRLLLLHKA
ncbi:DUF4407 domain-containing protein [Chitinophaga sp. NPDC101104]|uniref:DUF4407 domain-containing protein n=1 Tax=Chitinophaga sp. NPDC101104 TaxID=3390561 RepID=UPI003D04FADC